MRRKMFFILSFIVVTMVRLSAQESIDGISTPTPDPTPGDVVTLQTNWSTNGNTVSTVANCIFGTKNAYPIYFYTNNVSRMMLDTLGNIGIGTEFPKQKIHIVDGNILISRTSTKAPGSTNGSILFGSDVTNNYLYGSWGIEYLSQDGANGLNFWQPASSNTNVNNYVLFLNDNGNVGIGTYNPQAKLAVNGEILAKSVRVNTSSIYWPDYVFSPEYELMELNDLKNYVEKNKHLPGIQSAKEVGEHGEVDLGEMNTKLLEKIEELTLYIIDLQKQIDELKGKE
jgi:hypothetical protein